MKKIYGYTKKLLGVLMLLGILIFSNNLFAQLPFYDGFESGNFTAENWTITGNSEISTDSPFEGTYCVKGPGSYSIEQNFNPIMENEVITEFAMKASQTGSICVNFKVFDENNNVAAHVSFNHSGNIGAHNGSTGFEEFLTYSADTWYEIKVVLNNVSNTFDVYVDDELKANNFNFYSSQFSSPSKFQWGSGETWGVGWLDCIEIYTGGVGVNDEFVTQNEVSIYPNPTNGIINIDSNENFKCEIYSMQGLLVKSLVISDHSSQINISNLPIGMYLLNLLNQDGKLISSNKIIKE